MTDLDDKTKYDDKLTVSHSIADAQTKVCKLFVWSYFLITAMCIILGFYLVVKGATGSFQFALELKSMTAYIASLAPGLFFVICGAFVAWIGARRNFRYVIPSEGGTIKVESGKLHYK